MSEYAYYWHRGLVLGLKHAARRLELGVTSDEEAIAETEKAIADYRERMSSEVAQASGEES